MKQDFNLYRLIDLYFEGETTLEQERELRRLLAVSTDPSATIAEARAVIGVTARASAARLRHTWRAVASIAAAVAVPAMVAVATLGKPADVDTTVIAYVNGTQVTDTDDVMSLMDAQLASLSQAEAECDAEIDGQLSLISNAIENL